MFELIPGRMLGAAHPCFVIAELGANHNGDLDLARRLMDAAKEAGADCVKFQSWSKDSIFSRVKYEENRFLQDDYRHRGDVTMEQVVERYSLGEDELRQMKAHADSIGIAMTSTPFSPRETEFLVRELDAPLVKIASMDVNNLPLLEVVARWGRPVVLSTGLATLAEIDVAVRTLESGGCDRLVLLHCVAEYPPDDTAVHLRRMETLRLQYPECPVGFSDHTLGTAIPLAAIARGAAVIEKHVTLDKTLPGWDHRVSATPDELAAIVEGARRIPQALGSSRIERSESAQRCEEFRRGIVARHELSQGHILDHDDLDFKRPARGIAPDELRYVVGRRLRRSLRQDELLGWEDLQ